VRNRSVLKLGVGTGLVGIVSGQIQLSTEAGAGDGDSASPGQDLRLTLTDINPTVLKRARDNLYLPPSESPPFAIPFHSERVVSNLNLNGIFTDGLSEHPSISFELLDWEDALSTSLEGSQTSGGIPNSREALLGPSPRSDVDKVSDSDSDSFNFMRVIREANASLILGSDLVSFPPPLLWVMGPQVTKDPMTAGIRPLHHTIASRHSLPGFVTLEASHC
jgi:hypothetical protein